MQAARCPNCYRLKMVIPVGNGWRLRRHSADRDLSRFQSKERWNGPLAFKPCPGSGKLAEPVVSA